MFFMSIEGCGNIECVFSTKLEKKFATTKSVRNQKKIFNGPCRPPKECLPHYLSCFFLRLLELYFFTSTLCTE